MGLHIKADLPEPDEATFPDFLSIHLICLPKKRIG
jgi:hypothetical protein